MRTVSFRDDILHGIANELDLDIGSPDFSNAHGRKFANSATKWTRKGWRAREWPELTLTEERALRPIYGEDLGWSEGDEVYKIDSASYLRAKQDVAAGAFDASQWETIATPDPFIAYDQMGKQYMGEVVAVHATDPRLAANPGAGFEFYPEERGIRVPTSANPTVWITFLTRPSLFTADYHDPTRAYKADNLVYDRADGECFMAATDLAAGVAITNSAWIWQPVPFILAEYIRMNSAADASEDAVQKADFRAQADVALVTEIDLLKRQGQRRPHYRLFPRTGSRTFTLGGCLSSQPAVLWP